jgi:hypothetical protein
MFKVLGPVPMKWVEQRRLEEPFAGQALPTGLGKSGPMGTDSRGNPRKCTRRARRRSQTNQPLQSQDSAAEELTEFLAITRRSHYQAAQTSSARTCAD